MTRFTSRCGPLCFLALFAVLVGQERGTAPGENQPLLLVGEGKNANAGVSVPLSTVVAFQPGRTDIDPSGDTDRDRLARGDFQIEVPAEVGTRVSVWNIQVTAKDYNPFFLKNIVVG